MMSSDFYFRDKIPVAVVGAAEETGQRLVQSLTRHPWFEIAALYQEVSTEGISFPCSLVFSCLPSSGARAKEKMLAQAGYLVVSSSAYTGVDHIPLIVAEINSDHLALLNQQGSKRGIVARPHWIVSGLVLVLKPLMDTFGIESVQVNIPTHIDQLCIPEENVEIEQESLLILGQLRDQEIQKASFKINVQGRSIVERKDHRVGVSVKLKKQAEAEELIQAWRAFQGVSQQGLSLPTAPDHPLDYLSNAQEFPLNQEMSVYIEDLDIDPFSDGIFRFSFSPPIPIRSITGSMLLNAELLVVRGNIYW